MQHHVGLEDKIGKNPREFKSFSSLKETLEVLLFRYRMLDAKDTVLENEVQLVEAALGRIKIFGGTTRTVIDKLFVQKAVLNFFEEKDPFLAAAAKRAIFVLGQSLSSWVYVGSKCFRLFSLRRSRFDHCPRGHC